MKKIAINQIGDCISEALQCKKKNILFVSTRLEYEKAVEWFNEHPEYLICRETPSPVYEERNGVLVKDEGYYGIDSSSLEKMNSENGIWFLNAFSDECVCDFEGFLNIIKERYYINKIYDENTDKYSLEKMALFIGFTSPTKGDWAHLSEKYYDLFDEVYMIV